MSFAGWIRYFLSNYCLKYINCIFSPNWITDSPSGEGKRDLVQRIQYMILHLTTCPMMLIWSSTSMVTIQGVPEIWIYTHQDVQKNFVNEIAYINAVCCGMTCLISWKDPAHLMHLKDKFLSIYGYIYLSIYTVFNPSHISIMFLQKGFLCYVLGKSIKSLMEWLMLICNWSICIMWYYFMF